MSQMTATCPACDGEGGRSVDRGQMETDWEPCERCGGEGDIEVTEFEAMVLMLNNRIIDLEQEAQRERVEPIIVQLEMLKVAANENLVIRIDPKLEERYPGFLGDLNTALVSAGLGGRVFVLSLEPRHADVVVVPRIQ